MLWESNSQLSLSIQLFSDQRMQFQWIVGCYGSRLALGLASVGFTSTVDVNLLHLLVHWTRSVGLTLDVGVDCDVDTLFSCWRLVVSSSVGIAVE